MISSYYLYILLAFKGCVMQRQIGNVKLNTIDLCNRHLTFRKNTIVQRLKNVMIEYTGRVVFLISALTTFQS